ncbi:uncharacterized protein LOC118273736 isoform X2 [Spodoptera frugiperda]|nr:uncharacterized protein LOC118273736 isoform X2 [Spodoptera frugiperda]XP_035446767.2 uncharacterized protein LOC118273736 isoform X2 [Spodoptera frugiperda]XP_035446768.2 uncharacterized protein LOC118273736 isoform X2 [Spodoptera frugiperda]XP_035446769.2 uncharacterized protein LOC118273736 isoform X2 [Spodoptera frugiperda]XP_035446771.2 uncharacterized protein LOC118273736 isoform X2 [Spodoptera frugiperda]
MAQLAKGNNSRLRSIPAQFRFFFLFTMVFGSSFIIFSLINRTEIFLINNEQLKSSLDLNHYDIEQETSYTIKTEGCTIPGLTALDDTIKQFNRPPTKLKSCPNANYSLIKSNETHIWINVEVLEYYDVPREANVSCCYQSFFRPNSINDVYSIHVDDRALYSDCKNFSNNIRVKHEFVRVTCHYHSKRIYKQYFLFAQKIHEHKKKQNTSSNKTQSEYYNVIIMGMDSISRLNLYRTMPKTLAYLKDKGAIELLGYNKVDDNTFPNLTPMLLGIKETDLKRTCWPNRNANFDNCPFIWQWFKEAGFQTALGEDSAKLGTFNFLRHGFIKSPTDYYIRTFIYEAEKNVGNTLDFNSYICMGNKYFYKVLLDYIQDLTALLKNSKLFGFFWEVSMSHDYLTYPMAMDASYESFLKRLDSDNYLDKTVLILLSDHGMRWGTIRLTKQGRLEERLPFVHILLPPSFKKNYSLAYNNLKTNSKRLTTPYDIYATLSDLITLDPIKDENIKQRTESFYANQKSVSLFLPIPGNRTCSIAGIDDQWCTCHKSIKISKESFDAHDVAEELVKNLNNYLEEHEECAKLTLSEVLDVTEMMVGEPRKNEVGWREFMAVVRTTPGGGVFEGTLRKHKDKWSLAGAISRLNLYGNQSHCVHHYQLKLYCYCR